MAASPLTKARTSGSVRAINRDKRPLAAVKVWKGALAACNASGFLVTASGAVGEVLVGGRFFETVDNSAGAVGDKSVEVQYFRERNIFLLDNDTVAPVTVAQRERGASVLDDHTATLPTANGVDFIVYDVTSEGVWVELPYPSTNKSEGELGLQAGTTTLVAGTKTITGVTLTATSRIFLAMKDPGAGALTTFVELDAPVASRNTATGQFVINAIDNAKAVLATAVCTVDYLIVG